jgi:ABC-2 type transport system permease protein
MNCIVTLALKDLRLLSRDHFGLFWIFAFPLMFALFFGTIAGGGEEGRAPMPVAVVDQDHSKGSEKFIRVLEAKKKTLEVLRYESADEAREQVRRGKLVAFVLVKRGFGESAGPFGGGMSALAVGIDPRRQAEAGYLEGLLVESCFAGSGGFKLPSTRIEKIRVTREQSGPLSPFEVIFPSAILWGVMGCVATFAIALVTERVAGTFLRLRLAPLTRGQLLAGKGLACFLAVVGVAVFLLALGHVVFGVRLANVPGLVLAVVCTAGCFVGLMMLVSTLGKTEQGVAGAGWGIMTPLAMLGGCMVPLMLMPAWMQTVGSVSPMKWSILALEGAIWRDFSLVEMLEPCAILLAVGAVCFSLGVWNLARSEA